MTNRAFARTLAFGAAGLMVAALAVAWLGVDVRVPSATAPFYVALAVLGAAPLLFAAMRLGRQDDGTGAAVAVITSAALLSVAVFMVVRIATANGSYTFYFLIGLFLPPQVRLTLVAVPLLLTLLLLLGSAMKAWREIDRPSVRLGADGVLTIGVVLCAAAALRSPTLTTAKVTPYSVTTVQHELLHAYVCLWQRADSGATPRFPATLDPACLVPEAAPDSSAYGTGYTLEYRRRPNGFALVTTDAGHRPSESFWLDESGALRRSTGTPATAASTIWNADGCALVADLGRQLDDFRARHPAIDYPDRLNAMGWPPDTADDGVFRTTQFGQRDTLTVRPDGATEIRTWNGRLVLYWPARGRYAMSVTSLDPLRGARDSSLISDARLDLLRSYLRDSSGAIHVTGALRAATVSDPVVTLSECGG